MVSILTVGGVAMYGGALNSEYDAYTNEEMDALFPEGGDASTEEELSAIRDSLILNAESLTLAHDVDGRSTASLTIKDSTGAYTISERQQFIYSDLDMNAEFAGVVDSCQEIRIPGTNYVFHTIDAIDYNAILDWRIANYASAYPAPVLTGDVARALLSTYLEEEGITAGVIEDGVLLTQVVFSDKTLKECFDKLAEASNYIYYIDYDMTLHFKSRSADAAAWNISDGTDIITDTLTVTRNNPLYRNTESVLGGYEETDLMTEILPGDAETTSYALGFAVNRVSNVEIWERSTPDVFVRYPTITEKGANPTTYDFVYGYNSETVSFKTALAANQYAIVEYYGLWRVRTVIADDDAIAVNKARQGFGSGKIEHTSVDESLTSSEAASEYGSAKIGEYGVDGITINYQTLRSGLEVGTLQSFNYAGVNTDILIIRVSKSCVDSFTTYSVEGVTGPVNQSWETFFASHFVGVTSIGESQDSGASAVIPYSYSHTYLSTDSSPPDIFARTVVGGAVSDTNWPCFDPGDRVSYLEVYDYLGDLLLRKLHTQVSDESLDTTIVSRTLLGSSEANAKLGKFIFYGGSLATEVAESGVEIYRVSVSMTKSILASFQIDMSYINGA